MALIEVTVDHPSLISTDEDEQRGFSDEGTEANGESASETSENGREDTVRTALTAATTLASVAKQLRSEDELVGNGEESTDEVEDETEATDADAFEESVESEDAEDTDGDESSRLGLMAVFVLVIALVAIALWTRRGNEGTDLDDWD